eukprot:scaffold126648_cov63-Phaeocystis_antarctica.AAC.1
MAGSSGPSRHPLAAAHGRGTRAVARGHRDGDLLQNCNVLCNNSSSGRHFRTALQDGAQKKSASRGIDRSLSSHRRWKGPSPPRDRARGPMAAAAKE